MNDPLFVYGALRKGASDEWRMKDALWMGAAEVAGTLVKIDWYPGLVLEGEGTVQGEIYEVSSSLLGELDEFEGINLEGESNGEYRRIRRRVLLGDEEKEVWIYEWLKGIAGYQVIESGDWLSR